MTSGEDVFVVMGGSGEYSDRTMGVEGVFSTMADAEAYVAENEEFRDFIEPIRTNAWDKCPVQRCPVLEDGPEWGYTTFKKGKIAPLDTQAQWIAKVTANQLLLDRRKPVYDKWKDEMNKWTLDYWTRIYFENPRWQHRLVDTTGTKLRLSEDNYWIVTHKIDELVKKK